MSRTGTTSSPPPQSGEHGFSLIEILVVVVIIGVVTGAAVLSIRGSGVREVENAARRAQALVQLACERAIIGGRDMGFSVVREGLRFGYFELDGWRPLDHIGNDELRARPLGRQLILSAEREGIRLLLTEEPGREPSFICLSSGELTPFLLRVERADAPQAWELEGKLDGELVLTAVSRVL